MGDWAAVAKVVNERMAERGISQRALAEQSGVSVATLRQIQQGVPRQRARSTLAAVSRALGLPDDHLHRVSLGETHTVTGGTATAVEELREELTDLRNRVETLERRLPQ